MRPRVSDNGPLGFFYDPQASRSRSSSKFSSSETQPLLSVFVWARFRAKSSAGFVKFNVLSPQGVISQAGSHQEDKSFTIGLLLAPSHQPEVAVGALTFHPTPHPPTSLFILLLAAASSVRQNFHTHQFLTRTS